MLGLFFRTHPDKKGFYASFDLAYNIKRGFNLFASDLLTDVDLELNLGYKFKTLPLTLSVGYKDMFYTSRSYGSGSGIIAKAVYGF